MKTETNLIEALRKIGQKYSKSQSFPPIVGRQKKALVEMNVVADVAEIFGYGQEINDWIPTIMHDYVEGDTVILTEKELKHLEESGVISKDDLERNFKHHINLRSQNIKEGIKGCEPCFECKHIAIKLGFAV